MLSSSVVVVATHHGSQSNDLIDDVESSKPVGNKRQRTVLRMMPWIPNNNNKEERRARGGKSQQQPKDQEGGSQRLLSPERTRTQVETMNTNTSINGYDMDCVKRLITSNDNKDVSEKKKEEIKNNSNSKTTDVTHHDSASASAEPLSEAPLTSSAVVDELDVGEFECRRIDHPGESSTMTTLSTSGVSGTTTTSSLMTVLSVTRNDYNDNNIVNHVGDPNIVNNKEEESNQVTGLASSTTAGGCTIKVGDHIYQWCTFLGIPGVYQHHAIVMDVFYNGNTEKWMMKVADFSNYENVNDNEHSSSRATNNDNNSRTAVATTTGIVAVDGDDEEFFDDGVSGVAVVVPAAAEQQQQQQQQEHEGNAIDNVLAMEDRPDLQRFNYDNGKVQQLVATRVEQQDEHEEANSSNSSSSSIMPPPKKKRLFSGPSFGKKKHGCLRTYETSCKGWHVVQYDAGFIKNHITGRSGTCTSAKSDPVAMVCTRMEFLLSCTPSRIPTYDALKSNCECVAVWCKTGTWSTVQASSWLSATAAGQIKGAATLASMASAAQVTVPASGVWGWLGYTTQVSLISTQPLLLPAIAAYGVISFGIPATMLLCAQKSWKEYTMKLNTAFWEEWAVKEPEQFAALFSYWSEQEEYRQQQEQDGMT